MSSVFGTSRSAKMLVECFSLVLKNHVAVTFCLKNVRLLGLLRTDYVELHSNDPIVLQIDYVKLFLRSLSHGRLDFRFR